MAKVKAIAKQTLYGSYGHAGEGQEIVLNENDAKQLEKSGAIEITGEASDDDVTEKASSFSITDNTGKPKEKAEAETDAANPTGVKEKNATAGPAANKKTAPAKTSKKK